MLGDRALISAVARKGKGTVRKRERNAAMAHTESIAVMRFDQERQLCVSVINLFNAHAKPVGRPVVAPHGLCRKLRPFLWCKFSHISRNT